MKDFELLERIGLTQYERQTLVALLKKGVANAATLCEDGDVPSSKIYSATEKLAKLDLISIQRSRPRQFAALSLDSVVDRIAEIAHEQAEAVSSQSVGLIEFIKAAQVKIGRPLHLQMLHWGLSNTFKDIWLSLPRHLQKSFPTWNFQTSMQFGNPSQAE